MHAIEPVDGRTAASRLALIARRRCVIKIETACALQKISTGCRHVAQLRRRSSEDRAAQQWIALLNLWVIRQIAVWNESADAKSTIARFIDAAERQSSDVDQPRWRRHAFLD